MKVLVTGSDGMIGSALCKYLIEKNVDVIEFGDALDVRNYSDWDKFATSAIDYVVHLAAIPGVRRSLHEPELYYDINVNGTRNALDFASKHAKHIFYASSSNAKEWWKNPYATTKKMNEVQAQNYINATGMRFHTVWPGRPDMLFKKLERNDVHYVNTKHYRDFIHIDDMCSAIYTMLQYAGLSDTVVDIGSGHAVPVTEVVKALSIDTNNMQLRDNPTEHEREYTQANVDHLLTKGWTPKYNIIAHGKDFFQR